MKVVLLEKDNEMLVKLVGRNEEGKYRNIPIGSQIWISKENELKYELSGDTSKGPVKHKYNLLESLSEIEYEKIIKQLKPKGNLIDAKLRWANLRGSGF